MCSSDCSVIALRSAFSLFISKNVGLGSSESFERRSPSSETHRAEFSLSSASHIFVLLAEKAGGGGCGHLFLAFPLDAAAVVTTASPVET